jgi:hypothetical protein
MTTIIRITGPAFFVRLRSLSLALGVMVACGGLGAQECSAQLCGQLNGLNYTQNFNTLAVSGSSNTTTPIGFAFSEAGSGNNITYSANDGSSSTNNTYSYGTGSNTDRALGELTGGTVQSTCGACFVNNTDHPITSFVVSYTGEEWRLGAADGTTDKLDFQFSTNATSLTTGTWIDVNTLDFVTPNNSGAGAKDGNAAANRTVFAPLAITPAGVIQPEKTFFIRWVPSNISGEDDELAIDDFTLGTTLAVGLAGDYNNNGTVDAGDYLVWRKFLNQSVTIPNDITPGTVTSQDFLEWKQRFGKVNPPPSGGAGGGGGAAVPEPSTLFSLASVVVAFQFCRRHCAPTTKKAGRC